MLQPASRENVGDNGKYSSSKPQLFWQISVALQTWRNPNSVDSGNPPSSRLFADFNQLLPGDLGLATREFQPDGCFA